MKCESVVSMLSLLSLMQFCFFLVRIINLWSWNYCNVQFCSISFVGNGVLKNHLLKPYIGADVGFDLHWNYNTKTVLIFLSVSMVRCLGGGDFGFSSFMKCNCYQYHLPFINTRVQFSSGYDSLFIYHHQRQ